MDALTQWQSETRQQIVNEIGNAVLRALLKIGFQPKAEKTYVVRQDWSRKSRKRRTKATGLRPGTDIERVFQVIQKHPGNKGFQIQALLAQSGTVVHERTMRTCLNRLKAKGYIEQRGDEKAWFPTEGHKEAKAGQKTLL